MTRIDCHRPGAIIPSEYTYVCSYILPSGEDEGWEWDEAQAIETDHEKNGGKVFGSLGKCGVCGARFRFGDLWEHKNGELVHLGHDCADKYELLSRRPGFEAAKTACERKHKARLEAEAKAARFDNFCARHEGLKAAFEHKHYITADIASKLAQYGSISPAQIALVMKLAREATRPAEKHVPAPVGPNRIAIRGKVVSKKLQESAFGESLRMTVKVETPEGNWLAWGSCPPISVKTGDEIEFMARLEAGDKPHFAFFKRPTKARIVTKAEQPHA